MIKCAFWDMFIQLWWNLCIFLRGEVPGSAHGVLPAPLHLCHHGHQRGTQVRHQHQEADSAQYHLVQLRLKHTLQIRWTAAAGFGAPLLSGHTGNCSRISLHDHKDNFIDTLWAKRTVFFFTCFLFCFVFVFLFLIYIFWQHDQQTSFL